MQVPHQAGAAAAMEMPPNMPNARTPKVSFRARTLIAMIDLTPVGSMVVRRRSRNCSAVFLPAPFNLWLLTAEFKVKRWLTRLDPGIGDHHPQFALELLQGPIHPIGFVAGHGLARRGVAPGIDQLGLHPIECFMQDWVIQKLPRGGAELAVVLRDWLGRAPRAHWQAPILTKS